jgi:plastocyanin
MVDKKIIFVILVAAVLLASFAFIGIRIQQPQPTTQPETTVPTTTEKQEISPELLSDGGLSESLNELDQLVSTTVQVLITSSGFSPSTLTIKAGDTVTFINKDSNPHWPASDPHPTHTNYPGFDALRPLKTGESYSFTFTKQGTWGYHDHLNPSLRGTIIVK